MHPLSARETGDGVSCSCIHNQNRVKDSSLLFSASELLVTTHMFLVKETQSVTKDHQVRSRGIQFHSFWHLQLLNIKSSPGGSNPTHSFCQFSQCKFFTPHQIADTKSLELTWGRCAVACPQVILPAHSTVDTNNFKCNVRIKYREFGVFIYAIVNFI